MPIKNKCPNPEVKDCDEDVCDGCTHIYYGQQIDPPCDINGPAQRDHSALICLLERIKSIEDEAQELMKNRDPATDKKSWFVHSACRYIEQAREKIESII